MQLAPSILSADFARLGDQVAEALQTGVPRIHCDVMDGHFVPNISFGAGIVEVVSQLAHQRDVTVEVHLMITQPERYLAEFAQAGGDVILVHVETCHHLHRTVQMIHDLGAKAGVVLNPATPLAALSEVLTEIDQVLLMTVNPGFGGQKFIPSSLDKIVRLKQILAERGLELPIEIDGGVHTGTIAGAHRAGADIAVAGSAVFNNGASVAENIAALRSAMAPIA